MPEYLNDKVVEIIFSVIATSKHFLLVDVNCKENNTQNNDVETSTSLKGK